MDQLAAGLGDLNREARVAGRNQSQAWLQASNPAPAGGTWLSAQRGKPEGEGPSLPGQGVRLPPKPIGCLGHLPPNGAQSSGLRVSPWNQAHWPGWFHRGRPRGGPSGGNGTGATSAASHGPMLAIPRDTLGDRSRARKPASIDREAHAQGLASTTANQPEPAQRWQPRGAEALGKLLIGEAMGRPA